MSEFAHTLLANTEFFEENKLILDGKGIGKVFHKTETYKDSLRVLNSKSVTLSFKC